MVSSWFNLFFLLSFGSSHLSTWTWTYLESSWWSSMIFSIYSKISLTSFHLNYWVRRYFLRMVQVLNLQSDKIECKQKVNISNSYVQMKAAATYICWFDNIKNGQLIWNVSLNYFHSHVKQWNCNWIWYPVQTQANSVQNIQNSKWTFQNSPILRSSLHRTNILSVFTHFLFSLSISSGRDVCVRVFFFLAKSCT